MVRSLTNGIIDKSRLTHGEFLEFYVVTSDSFKFESFY